MKHLALIPGDGIGKDVTDAGMQVLDAVSEISGFSYDAELFDIGSERYLASGTLLEDGEIEELRSKDAIYFGAIGDPRVRPGVLEQGVLLRLRSALDQYINFRPVTSVHPYVPLKRETDFDIHFLRENTEDFYMGMGGRIQSGGNLKLSAARRLYDLRISLDLDADAEEDFAVEVGLLSRKGVERFADYSFRHAESLGQDKVTLVDKANVCTGIYGFQREIFEQKASEHGMGLDFMFVDAMAMAMITRPERYGTVAVPNLFGDILTDLGAQLQGGLGLGASGNINPEGVSMFEPIHGSAPDIAGKGIANPIAAVMALKMMLDVLGHREEGEMVRKAVSGCLAEGKVTPDLGGKLNTWQVAEDISARILKG
ncbi:MAG: isocitrate/isopropylmalate dehydrogenase family protein [Thermoplasmatales archaeon]|jgi:3-isopropylmalate dehydrogenase|nr:isocitrate/isopropylmalate dehydrogenase family protein [Thermoplasmatales archaeon]